MLSKITARVYGHSNESLMSFFVCQISLYLAPVLYNFVAQNLKRQRQWNIYLLSEVRDENSGISFSVTLRLVEITREVGDGKRVA